MLGFLIWLLSVNLTYAAEFIKAPHIQIEVLAPQPFQANQESLIGFRFHPDPHWHVYWKNPGDSGAAPKFQFTSKNLEVGNILWPYPQRLPVAHLTNLGYEGVVVYLLPIKPTEGSQADLKVNLEWLVCQEECIPGFGELQFSRPVTTSASEYAEATQQLIEKFKNRIPLPGEKSPFQLSVRENSEGHVELLVQSNESLPEKIDAYPVDPEYVLPAQPKIQKAANVFEILFQKSAAAQKPKNLSFVLVANDKSYEFSNLAFVNTPPIESTSFSLLFLLLASAFLGGVLLNLMPCVFPVISIKAFSLLKTEDSKAKIQDGLLYTLGVLTAFAALGLGFLFLRQLGSAVGWGFQLQSPLVVLSLIVLFWLMALNFLGVFEFGTSIMNTSGNLQWQSSFGTGVLSVFIAAPCTGPFMGTALGATATLPGYQALLIFLFLGFGLAFPYLALTFSHNLARRLPRPGAWMETLKQFFAFPLFATVLWLLWVLGHQTGTEGWAYSVFILLGISFSLWLAKRRHKIWNPLSWLFAISIIFYGGRQIHFTELTLSQPAVGDWADYTDEKLQSALSSGQSVFVDFTAAWCITCQVNKKVVLETSEADQIFEKSNILRLRADWTRYDPKITQALEKLGRNSVPVYAFYSHPTEEPQLLSQILTIQMIRDLISNKEEK